MNLKNDILEFKNEVINNGMCIDEYLNRCKDFIQMIDYESEKSMRFFSYLYFLHMISQEQYCNMKNRVDNSRKYYKMLLSFY